MNYFVLVEVEVDGERAAQAIYYHPSEYVYVLIAATDITPFEYLGEMSRRSIPMPPGWEWEALTEYLTRCPNENGVEVSRCAGCDERGIELTNGLCGRCRS